MITFSSKGSFSNTNKFFKNALAASKMDQLDRYGKQGVKALRAMTPKDSEKTADSWSYEIKRKNGTTTILWSNSHVVDGINIAVILQYGHGTRHGGWVEGRDYINSAIQPIFDEIAQSAWKEVTKS